MSTPLPSQGAVLPDAKSTTLETQLPDHMMNSKEGNRSEVASNENGEKEEDIEYPSSWRLASVVVALVLSMFLASLDMVRCSKALFISERTGI